jgi:hypothetical protein
MPEVREVRDLLDEAEVGAGEPDARRGVGGEPLDVHLVDDELIEAHVRLGVALPVEGVIDDDGLRHETGVVAVVRRQIPARSARLVGEQQIVHVAELAGHGSGVGVQEELRLVEAEALLRAILAACLVAVELPRPDALDETVPDELRAVSQLDHVGRLAVGTIEGSKNISPALREYTAKFTPSGVTVAPSAWPLPGSMALVVRCVS